MKKILSTINHLCIKFHLMPQRTAYLQYPLVIHQNVAALDVTMEEVLLVAIVESIEELAHDGGIVLL